MTRPSVAFAKNALRHQDYIIAAEIGVNYGNHSKEICDEFGDDLGVLFLVDPYDGWADQWGFQYGQERMEEMMQNLRGHKKTIFFRETSVGAANYFAKGGNKFDFVYIDGDHEYDSVLDDLTMWHPLVKKGGILAGHDYKLIPSVEKAVIDFCLFRGHDMAIPIHYQPNGGDDWWIIKGEGEEWQGPALSLP